MAALHGAGSLREDFQRDGFVLIRGLIEQERLLAAQRAIESLVNLRADRVFDRPFAGGVEELDGVLVDLHALDASHKSFIYDTLPHMPQVIELSSSPKVLEAVRDCLGLADQAPLAFINTNLRMDFPGADWEHRLPWHQDYPYRNKLYARGASAVVWMPVFDCPQSLGPVEIIPGSHHAGEVSTVEIPRSIGAPHWTVPEEVVAGFANRPVQPPMCAGDALVFDILAVHRSGVNTLEGRVRWTMQTRYSSPAAPTYLPHYGVAAAAGR